LRDPIAENRKRRFGEGWVVNVSVKFDQPFLIRSRRLLESVVALSEITGEVAARPSQAVDKTGGNWIAGADIDYGRYIHLAGERNGKAIGHEYVHPVGHHASSYLCKLVDLAGGSPRLKSQVLAQEISALSQHFE